MKYIVLAVVITSLVTATGVEAGKRLMRGELFATVGLGSNTINVSKLVDGDVTCYVTQHDTYGSHAISCVK